MAAHLRSRRARFTPAVDGLEARALLSTVPRGPSIVGQLPTAPMISVSTVPANGDVNPYGAAFVPVGFPTGGTIQPGDLLVSNFNAQSNLQGTGTTIVSITPSGRQSVFFQGPAGLGLTGALAVLKNGFVIVGSMPTTDGTSATVEPGSLLVLNSSGKEVAQVSVPALINGPWGMAVHDNGPKAQIFIANVLNGTVERFNLQVTNHGKGMAIGTAATIASGYAHRGDPAALELGPAGLAFDSHNDILYVASTLDNKIYAIPNAATIRRSHGTGRVVFANQADLHGPIGLALAPNGDLLAANGDAVNADPNQQSEIVEFTPRGKFVGQFSIDPTAAGAPFGIAVGTFGRKVGFAAVNDVNNTVEAWLVNR